MKAIFLKDLRENAKYALLLMLGVAVAVTWLLAEAVHVPLRLDTVFMFAWPVVAISSAAAALVLGFVPILTENLRDRWAFLVHRPVSRNRIFWGKVSAALVLWALAVGIPVAAGCAWVARPGRIPAPFNWPMLWPVAVDIVGGLPYYFAGILIAMRQARWYGSRILPLGVPLVSSLLCGAALPEAWQAILLSLITAAILAVAARGSFVRHGEHTTMPAGAKVALGVVVAPGIILAGAFALNILSEAWRMFAGGDIRQGGTSVEYTVLSDGQPVKAYWKGKWEVTTMDDQLLPEEVQTRYNEERGSGANLAGLRLYDPAQPDRNDPALRRALGRAWYRDPNEYAQWMGANPNGYWYYLPRERRFVNFDGRTARLLGSLGPQGFAASGQQAAPFEEEPLFVGEATPLLPLPHAVYDVNLGARKVSRLYQAPADQRVLGATQHLRYEPAPTHRPVYPVTAFVATETSILVFEDGQLVLRTPLAFPPQTYGQILVGRLRGNDYLFWYQPSWFLPFERLTELPEHIVQVARDGSIRRQTLVPAHPWRYQAPEFSFARDFPDLFLPPVTVPIGMLAGRLTGNHGMSQPDSVFVTVLVIMGALSALICAAVAYRYRLSGIARLTWPIIGLLLGAAGVLLMLCIVDLPARVPCPSCRRRRLVTRDRCEHCGSPFLPPVPDGTEVIEIPQASPC